MPTTSLVFSLWLALLAPSAPFTRALWEENLDLYRQILRHPFLTELSRGTLSRESFAFYMVQDAHYLREFARALNVTASKAPREEWAALLSRHAAETLEYERRLHETVFREYGIGKKEIERFQPAPEAVAYTSYLMATAHGRPFAESMSALLPCYWIYWEVGKELRKRGSSNAIYRKWIEAYASHEYGASVAAVREIVDQVASQVDEATRQLMKKHFRRGVRYEWMFWDSSYHRRGWPPAEK